MQFILFSVKKKTINTIMRFFQIQLFHAFRQAWDGALVMLDGFGPCMALEASR